MKKMVNAGLLFGLLMCFAGCYSDDGNYDYTELPDIKIETEEEISATQFKTLEVPVSVDFGEADESEYEYIWRIWSNDPGSDYKKEIARTKDLSYKVDEMPGSYTLVLTCRNKRTGVDVYKEMKLMVQGYITEGWLVLHEQDGKTDFDLVMTPFFSHRVTEDDVIHNVYESVNGERLEGRGVKIGSYMALGRYQYVTILTDKGGVRLEATKMQKAFDLSTLFRDGKKWNPQNYIFWHYYWSPGRDGYDAIISDGRFYEFTPIGTGFSAYTEPVLKDGRTYRSAAYAPRWFDYHQGIIFDELRGGFVSIALNTWVLQDMPEANSEQMFDWNTLNGSLLYMDTGFNKWEYGLIEDWNTHKRTLYAFNFDTKTNIAKGMWKADNCPEIENAGYYAVGQRGPVFYYATERDIYLYDYSGTNTASKVYTLDDAAGENTAEKITGMKILKPCVDRVIASHDYDNKVLVLSTYNENTREGKVYMYYINEGNGLIDRNSEKRFDGFGEILDMDYNWAKYGS